MNHHTSSIKYRILESTQHQLKLLQSYTDLLYVNRELDDIMTVRDDLLEMRQQLMISRQSIKLKHKLFQEIVFNKTLWIAQIFFPLVIFVLLILI